MGPRTAERNVADLSWFASGNCRDPKFEHVNMHPEDSTGVAEAKKVCKDCPVREQCREYALEFNEDKGVWGGLSERQRRELRKQRAHRASA